MTNAGKGKASSQESIYPQESLLKVSSGNTSLSIGIPKEVSLQENRVSLNPEAVGLLVDNGHQVVVESTAGQKAKFTDREYSEAGARISYDTEEVFKSSIVLKIAPPTPQEIGYLVPGKTLISALQIGSQTVDYLKALNDKRITGIAIEQIEDKVGGLPTVRAMSEIAGSTVIPIATEYLSSVNNGKGVLLGGITGVPPTKVVVLGAGTVAEFAARAALGLGAQIKVFDNHIYKLRRLKHALGQQIYTSTIDTATLIESLKSADVVIGAIRAERGRSRCIVTEEMVSSMKPDSIVIDVSIDQGGCFETSRVTTHSNPVFKKYDVIHYCVPNIASRVARTATSAFSHIFTPVLLQIAEAGSIEDMIFANRWFMKGVYTFKGNITNADVGTKFNMKCKDLSLFIGTRF
ncbi:MAG: alanine dehydrogenase [Cyclobacteriaceae bacterium]|nr:MAG: alanine dehydrogenase [Cyclobacteriaceae bacterium]